MTELPLTGGCNCGEVRFEVTEPLVAASYCHCKRCQRRSGAAASPSGHPAPGAFRIVAGKDKLQETQHAFARIADVIIRLLDLQASHPRFNPENSFQTGGARRQFSSLF